MSLPSHYLITPKPDDEGSFLATLERSLQAGTRLLQLRGKGVDESTYAALASKVIALARRYDGQVLLSTTAEQVIELGAPGLHLDSKALAACEQRPLPPGYLLAVSAHDLAGLQKGVILGADFGVLSPINYTSAHPDIEPLGWAGLQQVVEQLSMPIYALGGVSAEDEGRAIEAGAAGVAGNKGYW